MNVCSKDGHETYSYRVTPFALGCLFNASVVYMLLIIVLTSVLLINRKELLSFFIYSVCPDSVCVV